MVSSVPVSRRQPSGVAAISAFGSYPGGVATARFDAQPRRGEHERVRHVVAVAHEGQLSAAQLAERFLEGKDVGQRLAGMIEVAERVDHRHGPPSAPARQWSAGRRSGPRCVGPALQVAGHVLERLALGDRPVGAPRRPQLLDGQLEGQPGAQRGLLEEQAQIAALETGVGRPPLCPFPDACIELLCRNTYERLLKCPRCQTPDGRP
jgi:hypothetical protein